VTGGFTIGLLSIWQGTGHTTKPWAYWAVAIVGLGAACFRAWRDGTLGHTQASIEIQKKEQTIRQLERTIKELKDDVKPRLKAEAPQCLSALGDDGYANLFSYQDCE